MHQPLEEAVRVPGMTERPSISRSVVVAAGPEQLYDMVADITRMGEWSPACTGGAWDEGAGARVGSWFTGTRAGSSRRRSSSRLRW
jgi:Polyketide cyclase / dehydrase and lipid transport